jgi:radical SAM superfamily enzyme YgiQ (UPF0313 family)
VLSHPAVDYAAIGEGEQTFVELLAALADHERTTKPIDGLFVRRGLRPGALAPRTGDMTKFAWSRVGPAS